MPPNRPATSDLSATAIGSDSNRAQPSLVLGGLTPARFLAEHWQKRPLLIRRALPDFQIPFTADELAGLACEEEVESRLVLERDGERPWQLEYGPFDEVRFAGLPESHWTLLVNGCNRHVPALADLLDRFDFIPSWRVDDVMVSYAAPHGSVGPHVDQYDVFLLQGPGTRRWSVSTEPVAEENFREDTELRIMRDFHAERSWVLEPGDMLYLPPGVAHHGVALEPCLTFSIGFRAPSAGELLADFASHAATGLSNELRYADPDLAPPNHPGEISGPALARARTLVRQTLCEIARDDDILDRWFATFVTQSNAQPHPPSAGIDAVALIEHVRRGGALRRCESSRLAFLFVNDDGRRGSGGARLYVDGEEIFLEPSVAPLAPLLCDRRHLAAGDLAPLLQDPGVTERLVSLCNQGVLVFVADD